jgi:hypothetical protein
LGKPVAPNDVNISTLIAFGVRGVSAAEQAFSIGLSMAQDAFLNSNLADGHVE